MSDIIEKIQTISVRSLSRMVKEVIDKNANLIHLGQTRDDLLMHFMDNLNIAYDKLLGKVKEEETDSVSFEGLTLVKEEELSASLAVGGMISAARNMHLPAFLSFNTRLSTLFTDLRVDESNNPLDPQQITTAFTDAANEIKLSSENSTAIFKSFNNIVLKNIDKILDEANQLLLDQGVIPDLKADTAKQKQKTAKATPRQESKSADITAFGTIEEDPYDENSAQPELFSVMQNLMRPANQIDAPSQVVNAQDFTGLGEGTPSQAHYAVPGRGVSSGMLQPYQPAPNEQVHAVDQSQLINILSDIQAALGSRNNSQTNFDNNLDPLDQRKIQESLGELLQQTQKEGVVNAIDQRSSDVINLVTLLFEAIWQDTSVPIPIKELIGRTQITVIKVALIDTNFFNDENHPARKILNEFATAGIGWTGVDDLTKDPLYKKIENLVLKFQKNFDGDVSLFEQLIKDFRVFRAKEAAKEKHLEQRINKSKERQERIQDIRVLVSQKIDERILGRNLHPFISNFLGTHFHKFMVMLVVKEGPGSNAWKQSINTIDVLLWSVQPHEQTGDKERLKTVNPRLLKNLQRALKIAKVEGSEIESNLSQIQEVQNESFNNDTDRLSKDLHPSSDDGAIEDETSGNQDIEDDPILAQVDKLAVGIWLEFIGEEDQIIRCKLAARINAIDKLIFVNRQGAKVIEKTRQGLANELKDGTVKIINDGLLFSRALESVIGDLRESQHEQQTGGAYQADNQADNQTDNVPIDTDPTIEN